MKVQNYRDVPAQSVTLEGSNGAIIRRLVTRDDGVPDFIMHMFEVEPGGYFPRHAHEDEHEINFILEGEMTLVGRPREEYVLGPGDMVLINPKEEHRFENRSQALCKVICLRRT